ncbi:MAG TPA: translation initiation factor IF-3 [Anaerolineae bacterium]|nr:translation initiation factor IF-3 [Anaerolineae bacterium]
MNESIRAKEVRVIGTEGQQLGIMPIHEALAVAREHDLDLVEVAPNADPPVCRLLDYGKYIYERTKKEKEARRAQRPREIKEIRLRPKTGEYDVAHKVRDARRFLKEGCKVKVRVRFRGREITHPDVARDLLKRIAADLEDVARVEQQPRLDGRTMLMILSPTSK